VTVATIDLVAKALDGLSARYEATALNIANANSPGYRPIAVSFEDALKTAASGATADVRAVTPRWAPATRTALAPEMRLDLELATASQTAMRYGALIELLGRQLGIARAAVNLGQ
jgi:flagellar basal-body rod protein FlgB